MRTRELSKIIALAAPLLSCTTVLAQTQPEIEADLDFLLGRVRAVHPDPFRVNAESVWNAAAKRTRKRIRDAARDKPFDEVRVFLELSSLVALAADGHTGLIPSRQLMQRIKGAAFPMQLRLFDDGLFVLAADKRYAAAVGARVVALGKLQVGEALARVAKWVGGDNEYTAKNRAASLLVYRDFLAALGALDERGTLELTLRVADGKQRVVRFETTVEGPVPQLLPLPTPAPEAWVDARAFPEGKPPLWLRDTASNFWFEALPKERAVYAQINRIRSARAETMKAFVDRLFAFIAKNDVGKLVLDLRHNSGGNNYLNQPLIHALIRSDKIGARGTLFVLTGPRTFSAAVGAAADIEAETHAIFVGRPTGSGPNHAGDARPIALPNTGFVLRVSTLWWQLSDPRDTRNTIWPDVPVKVSFADFVAGRDRALEAALSWKPDGAPARSPRTNWFRPSQNAQAAAAWR